MTKTERIEFAPNLLERMMKNVAPKAAQKLYQDRVKFEMTAIAGRRLGGYIGARRDRAATGDWNPGGGSPAVDISPDLPMLRDRSRDQVRNAPVALGAINNDVLHVVGTGLSYTPNIDAKRLGISEEQAQEWMENTKWMFRAWAESKDCDIKRKLDFYEQSDLAYRTWRESGDTFVLTPLVKRNARQQLALQIIEADRVCNPRGQQDSTTLQDGIVLDAETGAPLAVHIARNHPGDLRGTNDWSEVPIRGAQTDRLNVIHLMDMLRPDQVRGVPWFAPLLEPLKQLNKWSDAELNAAVVSSLFVVFMEMEAEAFHEMFEEDTQRRIIDKSEKWSGKLESGRAVNLLPGEKANTQTPGRPNPAFDPFWRAMVRQMGMALGQPYEFMVMDFQSSYTAARAAFEMAWRNIRYRRDKMAKNYCQPILDLWLANEVSEGRIAAPGFFADPAIRAAWGAAIWTGDGPGSLDPVKEVTAAEKRVALGTSTRQAESILHDGQDWEGKQRQLKKEMDIMRRDGTLQPAPGAAPSAPPEGDDEEDEEGDDDDERPSRFRRPAAPPAPMPAPPTRSPARSPAKK